MSYIRTIIQADEPHTHNADLGVPRSVIRKWNIPAAALTIQFGSNTAQASVSGANTPGITRLRPSLVRSLHLPTGMPILLRYEASRQKLVFGPLIGILLSSRETNAPASPFGGLTPFLNEIDTLCRQRGGLVCAFTPDDVDWDAQTLRGMIRKRGSWQPCTLPLPQCIYNRLASRQEEKSEALAAWIERCKALHIPFFNEQFLNKWHVYQALAKEPRAVPFLPKTVRFHGPDDLKQMLSSYRVIYAKPANGSMGRGICRISKSVEGYRLTCMTRTGSVTRTCKGLPALQRALGKRTKAKTYLLQQGLNLIGAGSRPADFRVLVQKNRHGQWAITSLVARIGQNSVVSNVARGGTITSAAQALRMCGPWQDSVRTSPRALKAAALTLARLLDDALPGHYAEFGIDLGVDACGRIWLLEVNSKPSKLDQTLQLPEGVTETTRRARPSARRLLDYAAYLCGFPRPAKKQPRNGKTANKRQRNRR